MFRRLFSLVSLLSLLLCVATVVLWVRSYFTTDIIFGSHFTDEGQWTQWRQTVVFFGMGGVGVNSIVQSGPRATYQAGIEQSYKNRNPNPLRAIPTHYSWSPTYPDFSFGSPEQSKWGFKWGRFAHPPASDGTPASYAFELVVPMWSVVLLLLPLSIAGLWRWLRRAGNAPEGHCTKCRYSLTGNISGVCPECGTAVAVNKTSGLASFPETLLDGGTGKVGT